MYTIYIRNIYVAKKLILSTTYGWVNHNHTVSSSDQWSTLHLLEETNNTPKWFRFGATKRTFNAHRALLGILGFHDKKASYSSKNNLHKDLVCYNFVWYDQCIYYCKKHTHAPTPSISSTRHWAKKICQNVQLKLSPSKLGQVTFFLPSSHSQCWCTSPLAPSVRWNFAPTNPEPRKLLELTQGWTKPWGNVPFQKRCSRYMHHMGNQFLVKLASFLKCPTFLWFQ